MQDQKIYLTTGEFAKLCHTTKHTLFHYCDIDLFRPAYTDENGYRRYHVLQYDTFMAISELRTIGMSLAEIKSYLSERSPEGLAELYSRQEQLIDEQIARLSTIKKRISCRKDKIDQVIRCTQTFFVEWQKPGLLSCSEPITQRDDYAMTASVSGLLTGSSRDGSQSGMLCRRTDATQLENYPFRFYVNTDPAQKGTPHVKQAGSYLCTYHYGDYETLQRTYQDLTRYAKEQDMNLDDWIYAETIIGDWAVTQPQDYIIKVSVRIAGNDTSAKD